MAIKMNLSIFESGNKVTILNAQFTADWMNSSDTELTHGSLFPFTITRDKSVRSPNLLLGGAKYAIYSQNNCVRYIMSNSWQMPLL
jgi:hypothetical protein